MARSSFSQTRLSVAIVVLSLIVNSCTGSANSRFYGKTEAPKDNVLKYISGGEIESFDPQVTNSQVDARIILAIFDGLVENHPKTMEPIPAIAESWEISKDGTEYIFHLRKNAKFSDGTPISAKDFVYTFRRGLSPELASRSANFGYSLKYGEAYNSGAFFVKKEDGTFRLKNENAAIPPVPENHDSVGTITEFHKFLDSPERFSITPLELDGDEKMKSLFNFEPTSLKNIIAFANKIKTATDGFNQFLQTNLDSNAINSCTTVATCDDSTKQNLITSLNKAIAGDSFLSQYSALKSNFLPEQDNFLRAIYGENKNRTDKNKDIDKEIEKAETEQEQLELSKKKKSLINPTIYENRFLLDSLFKDEFNPVPLVAVKADDIGVESVDDYTLRLKLNQPTPYFLGLLAHNLFRVVPSHTVEKFKKDWTKPEHIVTSGAFKVAAHKPYDKIVVVRDPQNWDAANVHLDGIEFYPSEEATTIMNLYKTNNIYATYNHVVPAAWLDQIKEVYKDEYLDHPEVATEFYVINVKKPPMDNIKVRQAFSLAIDRVSLAKFRKTTKPLTDFTPEGIFPKYEEARKKVQDVKLKELKISEEDWKKRIFDPEKARKLLAEAGYPVQGSDGSYSCPNFPVDKVKISYNTADSNKAVAEFVQAQWKQNLGITVTLENMEFKTFLPKLNKVDYDGFGRRGWNGDYMDPFTFIGLFYTKANDGATGWWKQEFDDLLTKSNNEVDEQKRYELMAQAEFMVMQDQPIIPLMTQATNWIKKPFVKGLYPNPGTLHAWKFVYIEHDPAKWDTEVNNILKNSDPQVDEQLKQLMSTMKSEK